MSDKPKTPDSDDPLKADVQQALAAAFGDEAIGWLDDDDDLSLQDLETAAKAQPDSDLAETANGLSDLLSELGAAIEGTAVGRDESSGSDEQVDLGPRYVVFEVADQKYGLPIDGVLEIDRCGKVTSLPRTPHWLRGVTNLRGEILSVTDFRELLGLEDQRRTIAEKIIVVNSDGVNSRTALVVDRVLGIRNLKSENGNLDGLSDRLAAFADGLAINDNETTVLIDPDQLLGSNELSAFALD